MQSILARGCPTEITDRLQDAVHSKIVVNLTNALDALLGRGARPLSNLAVYQQLLTQALWEGVQVVRAAGYREHRIAGMPPFGLLHLVAVLPLWLTRPLFERRVGAMRMSSMTQDVVLRGAQDTELEFDHRLHRAPCRRARRCGSVQSRNLSAGPRKVSPRLRAALARAGSGDG